MALDEADLRNSWERFAKGDHFGDDAKSIQAKGAGDIIGALRQFDAGGEKATRAALAEIKPDSPDIHRWLEIEKAAVASSSGDKWEARAKALSEMAPVAPAGWVGAMSEGRRLLHLGEAQGRTLGARADVISDTLQTARKHFANAKDSYGAAMCDFIEGRSFGWRGRLAEAKQMHASALETFRSLGNQFRASDTLYELGVAHRDLHLFDEAVRLHRESIAIEDKRGNADSRTRAQQSLALTLIAKARAEASPPADLLQEAYQLAHDVLEGTTIERTKDDSSFRASVAARDLAEIALLRGKRKEAEEWLQRGVQEADGAGKTTANLLGVYVGPALEALPEVDQDKARQLANRNVRFEHVRLAEIEQQLILTNDPRERGRGLDTIAKAWELYGLPQYAIDAWLKAAEAAMPEAPAGAAAGKDEARPVAGARLLAQANADQWRYLARRRAESIGSHAAGATGLTAGQPGVAVEGVGDQDKKAAEQAGVVFEGVTASQQGRKIFQARSTVTPGRYRLLVRDFGKETMPDGVLGRIAHISRRRSGIPRIDAFGKSSAGIWLLDRDAEGPTLTESIKQDRKAWRVLRMLADIGGTVQALLSTGLSSAHLDHREIVVTPGDQPVFRAYGELFLTAGAVTRRNGGLYSAKNAFSEADDAKAYLRLVRQLTRSAEFASSRLSRRFQLVLKKIDKDLRTSGEPRFAIVRASAALAQEAELNLPGG